MLNDYGGCLYQTQLLNLFALNGIVVVLWNNFSVKGFIFPCSKSSAHNYVNYTVNNVYSKDQMYKSFMAVDDNLWDLVIISIGHQIAFNWKTSCVCQ